MEAEAIRELGALAISALDLPNTDKPIAALPKNAGVEELDRYNHKRAWFSGKLETQSFTAFVEYCEENLNDESAVFVDPDKMTAKAIINLGNTTKALRGDHTATLTLRNTPAYITLTNHQGTRFPQLSMCDWIEDWKNHITLFDAAGEAMEIRAGIHAIQKIDIKKSRAATTEVGDFKGSHSAMEQVEVKSERGLPAGFLFTCLPYEDFESRTVHANLRAAIESDKGRLLYRIEGLESLREAIAMEFREKLKAALDFERMYLGTFTL